MAQAAGRLSGVLEGKDRPADGADCLVFAQLCQLPYLKQYVAVGRFFDEAFTRQPDLAEDLKEHDRYNAAKFAARFGCGASGDAVALEENERAWLRGRALSWLWADLKAWDGVLEKAPHDIKSLNDVSLAMQGFLKNSDLAGVREPDALAKLPEAERQAWQELWRHAEHMFKRTMRKMDDVIGR
jgi:hypothetical protein